MRIVLVLAALCLAPCPSPVHAEEGDAQDARDVAAHAMHYRYGTQAQMKAARAALLALGPRAEAAVPHLLDDLNFPDEARRAEIVEMLVAIGAPAVPALTRGLTDWSGWVHEWSARALAKIGAPAALPAVPELARVYAEARPRLAHEAGLALHALDPQRHARPAAPPVDARSPTFDPADVRAAAQTLPKDLPGRTTRLLTGTPSERIAVAQTFHVGTVPAAHAVPALTAVLGHPDPNVRYVALRSLRFYEEHAASALPVVWTLARLDESHAVRFEALASVPHLGVAAHPLVGDIAKLLTVRARRQGALFALARMGEVALPQLGQALEHPSPDVRRTVVETLGHSKAPDMRRARLLASALDDTSAGVCYDAARHLEKLVGVSGFAAPALRALLKHEREGVRVQAARTLWASGSRDAELVPHLVDGAISRDIWLFEDVDEMLATFGHRAVPGLGRGLARGRAEFVEILEDMGDAGVPGLVAGLAGPHRTPLRASLQALVRMKATPDDALDAIAALLGHEDGTVRAAAAWALVPYGVRALRVAPKLRSHLERRRWTGDEHQAVKSALHAVAGDDEK